jgi:hypothetical protein
MKELRVSTTVKILSTQIEGQIKIVEKDSTGKPTHYYITLNKGATHETTKRFEFADYRRWDLVRAEASDVEYRNPVTQKDIYMLITEKDFEGVKLLSDKSLNKKPTVNAQKEWFNSMNYALMYGTKDIILYMLDKGLKPYFQTTGYRSSSRDYKNPYDLILLSTAIGNYDDMKEVWERFEKDGYEATITEGARIWGPMGYHSHYAKKHENAIGKLKLLFEKSFVSEKDKIEMLMSNMYNGYIPQSEYLISIGVNPLTAFNSVRGGDSCFKYCRESLIKSGSSLEKLQELYNERNK